MFLGHPIHTPCHCPSLVAPVYDPDLHLLVNENSNGDAFRIHGLLTMEVPAKVDRYLTGESNISFAPDLPQLKLS